MSSWPFPNVPDPAKKFPNELWALDQFNSSNLASSDGSRMMDDMAATYFELTNINETTALVQLNQLDRQILAIDNSLGRALIYRQEAVITAEEAEAVSKSLNEMSDEMKSLREKIGGYLNKKNDAARDMFESIGKSIDNIIEKGLAKRGKSLIQAAKDAQKALDSSKVAFAKAQKDQSKAAEDYFNRAAGTSKQESERLKQVWEESIKTTKSTATAMDAATALGASTKDAADVVQKTITGLTRYDLVDNANKVMKQIGIDIAGGWAKVERLAKEVHKSVDVLTKGYEKHLSKFLRDEEEASEFWKEARTSSREVSKRQEERIAREIAELNKLAKAGETEEFLFRAARYNTPSMRQFASIRDGFSEMRESAEGWGYFALLDASWLGLAVTSSSRFSAGVVMMTLEAIIGDAAATALIDTMTTILGLGAEILTKLLGPEVMAVQLSVELTTDLIRYGFGWRFMDDILGMVGVSLNKTDPGLVLKEYPEFSTAAPAVVHKTDPLKLNQYDSEEMAILVDFWGEIYINEMNKRGHTYPRYQKLKPFSAVKRIPGRYINPQDHPLDLPAELAECRQIENDLEIGVLVGLDEVGSGSQVARWYPKRDKENPPLVRNLAAFPAYEKSFHWPSLDGDVHQIGGWFNERSLDPTIYAAFVLWAESGTYGPVYNLSTNSKSRNEAVRQNKLDLAQWLDPKASYYSAQLEMDNWIDSNRGRKSVYFSDMILESPKSFNEEWSGNLPSEAARLFNFARLIDKRPNISVDGTIDMYQEQNNVTGRWLYHIENREFYNRVINQHVTAYAAPITVAGRTGWVKQTRASSPDEITLFTKVMTDGDKYKQMLEEKKNETQAQWDNFVLNKLWPTYVAVEKPGRTVFGFVQKYKGFFWQDLQATCNAMLGKSRDKAWKRYAKIKSGAHIPLNMNGAHRVAFMGRFAQLAYASNTDKGASLEKEIEKKFGKILENDVVTTSLSTKGIGDWAKLVQHFILGTIERNKLFPNMFGDLHCRMFVLNNPRVIVIAFRGTTNLFEWSLNVDFMSADFMRVHMLREKEGKGVVVPDIASHGNWWVGGEEELVENPDTLMVHRGFLKGYMALHDGIQKNMLAYMKKYDIQDVFITGHSLGAALTQIAGMLTPRLPHVDTTTGAQIMKNPHCYMFSSPNVGDIRFQDHFAIMVGETAQVWNDGDIVTSLPPFLIPARDITLEGHRDALESLSNLGKGTGSNPMAGLLWGISTLFDLADFSGLLDYAAWNEFESFSYAKMVTHAEQIYNAMGKYRPLRGGGAFFRLDYNTKGYFEEYPEDPGNTAWIIRMIVSAAQKHKLALALHSLDNVMDGFDYIARTDTDAFALNNKDLPAWNGGGGIKPHRLPHRVLEKGMIIGYAHTKHHHKSYTVVDKDDVDETDMLLIPQEMSVNVARAAKRHKHNLKDASYHGSHYY
jgi:hypothetical protein